MVEKVRQQEVVVDHYGRNEIKNGLGQILAKLKERMRRKSQIAAAARTSTTSNKAELKRQAAIIKEVESRRKKIYAEIKPKFRQPTSYESYINTKVLQRLQSMSGLKVEAAFNDYRDRLKIEARMGGFQGEESAIGSSSKSVKNAVRILNEACQFYLDLIAPIPKF